MGSQRCPPAKTRSSINSGSRFSGQQDATLITMTREELRRTLKQLTIWAVLLLSSIAALAAPVMKSVPSWNVSWQPARLVNGSPILFKVSSPVRLESLSGKWMDREVFFSPETSGKIWLAIAGVSVEAKPGKYRVEFTGKSSSGKEISFARTITVLKGKYRHISVNVPKQFTEPNPEQLTQIKEEQGIKHEVFSRIAPKREWDGAFEPPVKSVVSDVFGTARVFNGATQSIHQGLDYGVPSGTAVDAINRGTVLLARPLFFEGNCVVLDHGQGLLTIYMHLSKIEVKEGDIVNGGQEIALSGGTGRATGPHLHVAVRWQGIYVDPATLLGLRIPTALSESR